MRILSSLPILTLALLLAACARESETPIPRATPNLEATVQTTVAGALPTEIPTPTPNIDTPTPKPTSTHPPTPEPTPIHTPTPEPTPIHTPTPEPTSTHTPTPVPTPTNTPTPVPTLTNTPTPVPTPTNTPTPVPTPTNTPTPVPTPTNTPTPVPTPTNTPTPVPTPTNTPTPVPTPTNTPTPVPTPTNTPTPVPTPTNTPTPVPTGHKRENPTPPGETVVTSNGLGITIVSVKLDATSDILNANSFNDPPSEGNRFTILRVRVQNVEGSVNNEISISEPDFHLVGSSATLFSSYEHSCGVIPDELSLKLFRGGAGEGNVCFQIPEPESDLILFYEPLFSFNNSDRRWLQVANPNSVEPLQPVEVSLEPTPDQSPGHFRTNPTPPGETVTTSDGLGITIVSVTQDATSVILNANSFNDPPAEGNRFTILRVRVQNVGGSVNNEISISEPDFHLVGSSATLFSPFEHSCGVIPDELSLKLFRGGTGEGNVCFQIPDTESDPILFYDPLFSFNHSDRRWLQVANPNSVEPLKSVEVSLEPTPDQSPGHFRTNPTPPGETDTTSDGLGITIVSVTLDATSVVLNANSFNDPPSEGNRFTILRVQVQNVEGSVNNEISISESDFHLVGSSATLFSSYEHPCGVIPDELSLKLFRGGTGEGNVCFQIPDTESDLILFYDPLFSFNHSDRRWLVVPPN